MSSGGFLSRGVVSINHRQCGKSLHCQVANIIRILSSEHPPCSGFCIYIVYALYHVTRIQPLYQILLFKQLHVYVPV